MIIKEDEINKILSGELDKTTKKNSLGTVGYLKVRNFQLRADFFLMQENFKEVQKLYNYLYTNVFTQFLDKNKSKIFDLKEFEHSVAYYYDSFLKYTIKALLKNNKGQNFFTYLNRWIFKFLSEYYESKKKEMKAEYYLDDINIDIKRYKDRGTLYHNKTTEQNNIKYAIEKLIYDLEVEDNPKQKTLITNLVKLKTKIENEETITDADYNRIISKMPYHVMENFKSLLIG